MTVQPDSVIYGHPELHPDDSRGFTISIPRVNWVEPMAQLISISGHRPTRLHIDHYAADARVGVITPAPLPFLESNWLSEVTEIHVRNDRDVEPVVQALSISTAANAWPCPALMQLRLPLTELPVTIASATVAAIRKFMELRGQVEVIDGLGTGYGQDSDVFMEVDRGERSSDTCII